jgi:hypothetical protein
MRDQGTDTGLLSDQSAVRALTLDAGSVAQPWRMSSGLGVRPLVGLEGLLP